MRFILLTLALLALPCIQSCTEDSAAAQTAEVPRIQIDSRLLHISTALSRLPPAAANTILAAINARPAGFFQLLEEAIAHSEAAGGLLQLADKTHALPADFVPADLVRLAAWPLDLSRNDHRLRQVLMDDLLEMVSDARQQGVTLLISSTYRSYDYQTEVYARHMRNMGQTAADKVSARPGHSQHQLGTAIDFGSISDEFAETAAGKWLDENAWLYGFSLSYPQGLSDVSGYSWESWHYRYTGRAAAQLEQQYFMGVQQYLMLFLHHYFTQPAAS
ncbi:MAG: M15 family metallopeptidase [Spirochaetes bacterium]|nr:M15 family metallopeptidase [Spirochaetota bacterium]MBU0955390.1 M15 family metallopeptidase [Spirochaetota bacterium]